MSKIKLGPEFDPARKAARAHFRMVTPFRLGCAVAERGEYIISPYAPGSYADKNYRAGLRFGKERRDKANATGAQQ